MKKRVMKKRVMKRMMTLKSQLEMNVNILTMIKRRMMSESNNWFHF